MRKGKKFLALVAAMAMVMAPTTTWAAQSPAESTGEAGNAGSVEGVVDKNYVSYVAPTVTNNTFNFVLDPQSLIATTDGATIKDNNAKVATEEGATVYFKNSNDKSASDPIKYATSSDALTITNKGSGEISVSVNATLDLGTTGAAINVVTGAVAESATDTALNLKIHLDQVNNTGSAASVVTTTALEKDSTIATKSALDAEVTAAGADKDDFEVTKTGVAPNKKYEYIPKNDDVSGDSVYFVFRGECNPNEAADWSKVKDMSASFKVVWDVQASSGVTEVYGAVMGSNVLIGSDMTTPTPAQFSTSLTKADVTNLQVAGHSLTNFTVSGGYVRINSADAKAAAGDDWAFPLTITFTISGKNYKTEITP